MSAATPGGASVGWRLRLVLDRPPKSLRLHVPRTDVEPEQRLRWLLHLRERQEEARRRHEATVHCLDQLRAVLAQVPALVQAQLAEVTALAAEIGLQVAREVVGAALAQGQGDPAGAVARCLQSVVHGADQAELRVLLAPEDLTLVLGELDSHPDLRETAARVTFVPDARQPRGAVRVETGAGRLVYDPREVLERIAQDVRKELGA